MYRTLHFFFILFILSAFLFGCSSTGNNPVDPVTPDEQSWIPERYLSESTSEPVTEDYWNSTIKMNGETWIAHINPNGTIERASGRGVTESTNPFEVIDSHPDVFLLSSDNFREDVDETHGNLRYVLMYQVYDGLRIHQSRLDMRYFKGDTLVLVGANVYADINVNTTPTYPLASAMSLVESEVGPSESFETSELVIFVSDESTYLLAWRLDYGNWVHWIDAHNGAVIEREHHEWNDFTGNVNCIASQPDPLAPEIPYPMVNLELRMRVNPNDEYPTYAMPITDQDGNYSYYDSSYTTLDTEVRFYGPYLNTNNWVDENYEHEAVQRRDTHDGVHEDWYFDNGSSIRDERTCWVWVNATHDFQKSIDPTYTYADFVVGCYVNWYPLCNAMANEQQIVFFQYDGYCLATGTVPDVIVHEYGHVNTFQLYGYNQPPLMIHEGYSDAIANIMIEDHYIGYNIAGEGSYFRDSKNNYKWPADWCDGESHCLGQLLAGAFWDMYEYFGKEYTGYLYLFSRYGRPMSFPQCGLEVMIADDNDGDWTNGTPNYEIIYECFETNHNINIPEVTIPEGIDLEAVPTIPDIHIGQAGGSFSYDLTITNQDDAPTWFQIWAGFEFPGGYFWGPIIPPGYMYHAPYSLTWAPEQVFNITLTQHVPPNAPPGEYEYHVRAGEYVDNENDILMDDVWFTVTIDPY